jgi:hypothetical protein
LKLVWVGCGVAGWIRVHACLQGGRLLAAMLNANTTLLRLQLSPMDGIDLPDMQAITGILQRNNVKPARPLLWFVSFAMLGRTVVCFCMTDVATTKD